MNVLIVVDMQNDFIDGALGTPEAVAIVPQVAEKIKSFQGKVLATQDTHGEDYLDTQEGRKLPVRHCIRGTKGWEIQEEIRLLLKEPPLEKTTFGSRELGEKLLAYEASGEKIEQITLLGLCTDICVISNALLLKAYLPEVPVIVEAECCAGVTPQSHKRALEAMEVCQIEVR